MKQRVTLTWPSSISAVSASELGLHVADHVLLDEEAQVAVVQVLGQRRRQRQDVGGELAHLLRHLQLRHRVADQRLVHVEVEEADLGVGDPPHRLGVDADQLQEGDEREAGGEHAGAVAQRRRVLGAERRARRSVGVPRMTRIRSTSSGSSPVSAATSSTRQPLARPGREELLGEAEGEPALAPGLLQVLQRVAALAHPRHHPRLRRRRRGPAAAPHRHDLLFGPAFQRAGRHPRAPRRLAEGDPLVGHQGRG